MKIGKAFLAGVVGGVATTLIGAIARAAGMSVNFEETLGSMVTRELGPTAFSIGLMMHLVISGLIALVYAAGFEFGTRRADWRTGMAFSLLHTFIAGLFLVMMPVIHPLIPSVIPPPGAFLLNLGAMGVTFFILIHVAYGAIVGAIYGPVEDRPVESQPVEDLLDPGDLLL